jgi:hypothetical protein
MHIMNRQQREDLGLAKLPPEVKQYIADLEYTVDRLQARSKAHRDQLRACNAKLETVNLRKQLPRTAYTSDYACDLRRSTMRKAM